jgi:hypothetical protein
MADDSIFKVLSAARDATGAAQSRIVEIDAEIHAISARVDSINDAPLTKADFLATMAKAVRAKGDQYLMAMARGAEMPYGMAQLAGTAQFRGRVIAPGYMTGVFVSEDALCLFGEDGINAGWRRIADAMDWPASAPSMEERVHLLEGRRVQAASLLAQRAALVGALGGAFKEPPVRVELHPHDVAFAAAAAEPHDASALRVEAKRLAYEAVQAGKSGFDPV